MNPLNILKSEGCTTHHFETVSAKDDYRIRWDSPHFVLEQKARMKCAHEGCYERKKEYVVQQEYSLTKDGDDEFYDENMGELNEVLRWIRNEVDR